MPTSLDTRVLDDIIRNLPGNRRDAIAKVAFSLEARTKINIRDMGAVDTGALLNSVAVSMQGNSDVDAAMAEARARNPDAEVSPLPVPGDDHTAYVGPTVGYATEVHFGTGTMPGRPYLLQAVQDVADEFKQAIGDAAVNRR